MGGTGRQARAIDALFLRQGISYNVYGDSQGADRGPSERQMAVDVQVTALDPVPVG
ncbi:MAG: hypothetical protein DUW69_001585 [Verrucomicrobia bacterium]|nr:MAG: hypothetical protein DUW69_001585 [Verrucomicrobiota bacterium]